MEILLDGTSLQKWFQVLSLFIPEATSAQGSYPAAISFADPVKTFSVLSR